MGFLSKISLTILILFFCYGSVFGIQTKTPFSTTTESNGDIHIQFKLPAYQITKQTINNKEFTKISIDNSEYLIDEGKPELPFFSTSIAVPLNSRPEILYAKTHETSMLQCDNYVPCQKAEEGNNTYCYDLNFYNKNTLYPETFYKLSEIQTLRDYQIVHLNLYPVRYNPSLKKLEINNQMEIKIQANCVSSNITYQINPYISSSFENIYKNLIENYSQIKNPYALYQPPSILIIYPDNASIVTALSPYIEWKKQLGYYVKSASTAETGTTSNAIKSYIQNLYNTSANKPEYILIIGDANGSLMIPTISQNYGFYTGTGDYPYTHLAGSDYTGDAMIGRLSIDTSATLSIMISKILSYEKNPTQGGTSWFNSDLLVGDTSPSGVSCISTNKYIKEITSVYEPANTYTELYGSEPSPSSMQTAATDGCLFFNYRGYIGMSSFTNTNITALNNIRKLFYGVWITCDTGNFSSSTTVSRIETATRLGTTASPRGAIVALGMSTSHTLTPYNNIMSAATFHGLYVGGMTDLGQAQLYSKIKTCQVYSNFSAAANDLVHWNNMMGDPSLKIFKSVPKTMTLTAPTELLNGQNSFSVHLSENNTALSNVTVTLKTGSNEFFAGKTDQNGDLVLIIPSNITSELTLTASKPDYIAIIQTIAISTQSVVGLSTNTYNDASGNNDNLVNSGELITMSSIFKNFSSNTVSSINIVLQAVTENLIIIDSMATISQLNSGSLSSGIPFSFKVSGNCPDNEVVGMRFIISSGTSNWYSHLSFRVYGTNLSLISYNITGSSATQLPIGQTTSVNITIKNTGYVNLEQTQAVLRSKSSGLIIADSLANYGNINQNTQLSNISDPFSLSVNNSVYPGTQLMAELIIKNSLGIIDTIPVRFYTTSVTTANPTGPDNFGYLIFDWNDTAYSECPVYQWEDIISSGTNSGLSDMGDNGDVVTEKTLPFSFNYYGVNYNTITISSNGWFSFGSTAQTGMRNTMLPFVNCPANLVAVFWSDLIFSGTNSGVYTYYNSTNHSYIIQWNNVRHFYEDQTSSAFSFQAILYDSQFYTGSPVNGVMKLQYQSYQAGFLGIADTPSNYFSVGLQNHNGTDGLTYVNNNTYHTSASTLSAQKALFISTQNNNALLNLPSQLTINEDTSKIINLSQYLNNYSASDSYQISVQNTSHLSFSVSGLNLSVTPQSNWSGNESFIVQVTNLTQNRTGSDNMTLIVKQINDAPFVRNPIPDLQMNMNESISLNLFNYFSDPDSVYNDHLLFSIQANPDFNLTVNNMTGLASLTPNQNWYGNTTLTFKARDDSLAFITDIVNVTVNQVALPPVISFPAQINGTEDQSLSLNLTNYISDPDTPFNSLVISIQNSTHISTSLENSNLTIMPASNWFGSEYLHFSVSDQSEGLRTGKRFSRLITTDSLKIVISPINDAPQIILPDNITINEDNPYNLNCENYISDVDNAINTLSLNCQGSTHINANFNQRVLTLTPQSNWFGSETLTISVNDGLLSSSDNILVIVNPVNDAPTISLPETINFDEDTAFVFNVESCISDPDNPNSALAISTQNSTHISTAINQKIITFTPQPDWSGNEIIQISVSDGLLSTNDYLQIVVNPVNEAPQITLPEQISFNEDSVFHLNVTPYISDIDTNPELLTITINQNHPHLSASVNLQDITLIPENNWYGTTELTVTVSDGLLNSTDHLSIQILPVNDAPILNLPSQISFSEDNTYDLNLTNYISDPDNSISELSFIASSQNQEIQTEISGNILHIIPQTNWFGSFSLNIQVNDGSDSDMGIMTGNVLPINDSPVINMPAIISCQEDSVLTLDLNSYCSDADNLLEDLIFSISNSQYLSSTINNGVWTMTPLTNWNGNEYLTLRVSDGQIITSQIVQIQVNPVNDPHTLNLPNSISLIQNGSQTLNFNNYISDNDQSDYSITYTNNEHIQIETSGLMVSFYANSNWNGYETIHFTVSDNENSSSDDIIVRVNYTNTAPITSFPANISFNEDTVLSLNLFDYISDNESALENLTISFVNAPHLQVSKNNNHATVHPVLNWSGTESISVIVSDGTLSTQQQIMVTVTPVNDAPVISLPQLITFNEDTPTNFSLSSYLSDIDNPLSSLVLTCDNSEHLTVSITQFSVRITPQANWYGTDSLAFHLNDSALTTTAKIAVRINPVNDAPLLAFSDLINTNEDTPISIDLTPYLIDPDNGLEDLSVSIPSTTHLSVVTSNKHVTITPQTNWFGNENIIITVTDGLLNTVSIKNVSVASINDSPIINLPDNFILQEDNSFSVSLNSWISDIDNSVSSLILTAYSSDHINVSISQRNLILNPVSNWVGSEMIRLSVSDNTSQTTDSVMVIVQPVNDPPTVNFPSQLSLNEDSELIIDWTNYIADLDNDYSSLQLNANTPNNINISFLQNNLIINSLNNWAGTTNLTITVSDGTSTIQDNMLLIINPVNDAPVLSLPEFLSLNEDNVFNISYVPWISDIDSPLSSLILSAVSSEHISVGINQQNVSLTPQTNWYGNEAIVFSLTDGNQTVTNYINVQVNPVNDAPVINLPESLTINEDQSITINLSDFVTDTDNTPDQLTVSITDNALLQQQLNGFVLTLTPQSNWSGQIPVIVSVSDGVNRNQQNKALNQKNINRTTSSDQFVLVVQNVNDIPYVMAVPDTVIILEDNIYTGLNLFTVFADADLSYGDHLTFSTNQIDSISVSINNGILSMTPYPDWYGNRIVQMTAVDDQNQSVSTNLYVTVLPVNDAPSITLPDHLDIIEDNYTVLNLAPFISDMEQNNLFLSVSGFSHVNCLIENNLLRMTPQLNWNGTEMIYITVNDSLTRASTTDSLLLVITPANDNPIINLFSPDSTNISLNVHSMVNFEVNAEDPDNDTLSYTWLINDIPLDHNLSSLSYNFDIAGQIEIKCKVSDGFVIVSQSWSVHVNPVDNNDHPVYLTNLFKNYPNPFNPETKISYTLSENCENTISIYNIKGQIVKTLLHSWQNKGLYTLVWDGKDTNNKLVSSGIYYCVMKNKNYRKIIKMTLLK